MCAVSFLPFSRSLVSPRTPVTRRSCALFEWQVQPPTFFCFPQETKCQPWYQLTILVLYGGGLHGECRFRSPCRAGGIQNLSWANNGKLNLISPWQKTDHIYCTQQLKMKRQARAESMARSRQLSHGQADIQACVPMLGMSIMKPKRISKCSPLAKRGTDTVERHPVHSSQPSQHVVMLKTERAYKRCEKRKRVKASASYRIGREAHTFFRAPMGGQDETKSPWNAVFGPSIHQCWL